MSGKMTKPKQMDKLKSDVRLLRQQLINTYLALKFLSEMDAKPHTKEYIDEMLKLSAGVLSDTNEESENK
ncbi:putative coil containing protein [Vibrio phage 284E43-1]|nr:putative coil containing protein [Vibrio phage 284E43-1]